MLWGARTAPGRWSRSPVAVMSTAVMYAVWVGVGVAPDAEFVEQHHAAAVLVHRLELGGGLCRRQLVPDHLTGLHELGRLQPPVPVNVNLLKLVPSTERTTQTKRPATSARLFSRSVKNKAAHDSSGTHRPLKYSRKCSSFLNSRRVMKPFPSRSAALYALISAGLWS